MKTLKEFTTWLEEQVQTKPVFDFEQFSQFTDRSKALRYLVTSNIKQLGSGTFRAAFQLDENRVIKIATINEGVGHNQREFQHAKCIGPKHAIQVLDHHPEFWWLIEERADLLDDEQFVASFFQHLGVNQNDYPWFDDTDIRQAIELSQSGRTTSRYKDDFVFEKLFKASQLWLKTSFWYRGLIANLKGCRVGSDDFGTNNWGVRPSTGELVLLDVGFNPAESDPEKEFFKEEVEKLGFSLEKLKTFDDTKKIIDYCYEILGKPLGFGSGRMVWAIDKNKIIKVARYQPSRQNEKEFENSFCLGKKYAVEVLDYDINGFKWLIEERVDTFKTSHSFAKYMNELFHTSSSEWEELFGSASLDMFDIADIFADSYQKREMKKYLMQTNEWFRSLVLALNHCIVASHDFHDGNWGIRPGTGELILIDLGF